MPKKFQNGKLETRDDVKRKYYFVRVTVSRPDKRTGGPKPKREPHKLGFCDEMNKKEALKARSLFLQSVNSRQFVLHAKKVTFKELERQFTETRLSQFGVATQAQYRSHVDTHLLPAFGELKLCDIDRSTIEQFLTAKADSLGWWSRDSLRKRLSGLFIAAKEWGMWEGENPALGIRLGKKRYAREKRLLTVEQMRLLLAALPDRTRFLALVLFGLGLRISEALGLQWRDIDFDKASISIRRRWYRGDLSEETKSEASTAVLQLGASMMQEFQKRYPGVNKRAEFLFLGDDGETPPDDRDLLRFEFRPVLKRLGFYSPGMGWHFLRRLHITWRQTIGGATPMEAQKAARHASLDMTYLYSISDHERETAQQQRMFDELMGTGGEIQ